MKTARKTRRLAVNSGIKTSAQIIGGRIADARLAARTDRNRKMSLPRFYEACRRAEEAWVDDPRDRRFGPVTESWASNRMRKIELGEEPVNALDLKIFAQALGLPTGAFDDLLPLVSYGPDALRERPAGVSVTPTVAANDLPLRTATGFRRIAAESVLPPSRDLISSKLKHLCAEERPRLVVVEGQTGAGKSFFLSHWFETYGRALFGGDALMLDCATGSADQILPAVARHLQTSREGQSPAFLASVLAAVPRYLLVIDGLVAKALKGRAQPNSISFAALQETVLELATLAPNMTLVLCIENNGSSIFGQTLLDRLVPEITIEHIALQPLTADGGADFLLRLLSTPMPRDQLKRISDHHQGMPLALTVAAAELDSLGDNDRERYAAWIDSERPLEGDFGFQQFRDLVARYVVRLEYDRESVMPEAEGASVQAFLKLIALMPGPTPVIHIEELLSARRIRRLETMTLDKLRLWNIPFLTQVDGSIDVHALVRRMYRADIEASARTGVYDTFTSREELEWIHWRAALMNWAFIKRFDRDQDADSLGTGVIEAFVYHIRQLISLTPAERRRRKPSGGLRQGKVVERFEANIRDLADTHLWDLAYYGVVQPFLLERRFKATRIHGQYDLKARVLDHLVQAAKFGLPIPPAVMAEIHKEAALCLMHGGHVNTAHAAAGDALNVLRTMPVKRFNSDLWRTQVDIESVRATAQARMGRGADHIAERLATLVDEAETILKDGALQPGQREWVDHGHAGALRVFSRLADVHLQMGRIDDALQGFQKADELQKLLRGRRLDGEAARKFVVALVRSRSADPDNLEAAVRLVRDNIDYYREQLSTTTLSSDLVPFLLQEIALDRIHGRLEPARAKYEALTELQTLRRSANTFLTSAELTMEDLRLQIAEIQARGEQPWRHNGLHDSATELSARMHDSHHRLAFWESELLRHEGLAPDRRASSLAPLVTDMRRSGWLLRQYDAQILQGGGSAVLRFGL